jgi:hypothetical protein
MSLEVIKTENKGCLPAVAGLLVEGFLKLPVVRDVVEMVRELKGTFDLSEDVDGGYPRTQR